MTASADPPQDPERPGSRFSFTSPRHAPPGKDLLGVGADLAPGTLLAAYTSGYFPMGLGDSGTGPVGWWSPDPRGVLPVDGLQVSRSLRRSVARFEVRVDTAFADVVRACADPDRPGAWITDEVMDAYCALHAAGWAHSVECWSADRLVGGLYGVAIGGLFAAESKFHLHRDASKVAVVALVEVMRGGSPAPGERLIDVQWCTEHLATLGVVEVPRTTYLSALSTALASPSPDWTAPSRTVSTSTSDPA